jgi:hypothetical protein
MSDTREFVERFRAAVLAQGGRPVSSPFTLIDKWRHVVDLVEDGYNDNIYEYINDLSVRDLIDRLLRDAGLAQFEQMEWFRAHVREIDAELTALLRQEPVNPDPDVPWWRARIPAYAGAELVADLAETYGVVIDER